MPVGVGLFDEANFPVSFPGFHLLLALDGGNDGVASFEPNELIYFISLGEAGYNTRFVLIHAFYQIASNAYV